MPGKSNDFGRVWTRVLVYKRLTTRPPKPSCVRKVYGWNQLRRRLSWLTLCVVSFSALDKCVDYTTIASFQILSAASFIDAVQLEALTASLGKLTRRAISVQCSVATRSHNHCCRAKAFSFKYYECASVGTQHAKRPMRRVVLSPLACPDQAYFSTLSHKQHDFQGKKVV